jgi:hypothetical protein
MTPEDFKELEEETAGSFTGIGIEITIRDGVLTAVAPSRTPRRTARASSPATRSSASTAR